MVNEGDVVMSRSPFTANVMLSPSTVFLKSMNPLAIVDIKEHPNVVHRIVVPKGIQTWIQGSKLTEIKIGPCRSE